MAERGVESPRGGRKALAVGSEVAGPMRRRELLQPREIDNRKGGVAEPIMSRRRQQTAPEWTGAAQDTPGVRGGACGEGLAGNRRDPTWRPTLGEGGAYKPSAKGHRAGRESAGSIVPRKAGAITPPEGRDPSLVASANEGKREGMIRETGSNYPVGRKSHEKVRKLQGRLFVFAKLRSGRGSHVSDKTSRGDGLRGNMRKAFALKGVHAT